MPFSRADLAAHFRTVNDRDPTPDELDRLEREVPTTVSLGQGAVPGQGNASGGLERVHQDALAAGLDEEGARAAMAIAKTEGGMTGAVGDLAGGGSAGTFQLYFGGGQGNNFARAHGMSEADAKSYLVHDPHAANRWALSGYLGQAIKAGIAQGLSGPDLATYAQRHGQVSVSPERAGQNYQALFAGQPPASTAPTPRERQSFLEANAPGESTTIQEPRGAPPSDSPPVPDQPAPEPNSAPQTTPGASNAGLPPWLQRMLASSAFARGIASQVGQTDQTMPTPYQLPPLGLPGFRPTLASPYRLPGGG